MIKVLFVCHGNICRSPMAEFIMKDMAKKRNLDCVVESCATSYEEIGNDIHYGTKRILDKYNIPYDKRKARRITMDDYQKFDLIICMDQNNMYNLKRINSDTSKVHLLLEFVGLNRDVLDPWYTGDFQATYDDIVLGIKGLIDFLEGNDCSAS